jgi:thymidine kinase
VPTGSLEVITGGMFSGKTEELIRRLERVRIARGNVLLFKPTIDDRYSQNSIVTHYGREFEAIPIVSGEESLEALAEAAGKQALEESTVIAFDEGNFFTEKLYELCETLICRGKRVIVAGLDLTFDEKPFGPMPRLMALADQVDKIHAVCVGCGKPATRSHRITTSKETIKVGGTKDYEALCTDCYRKVKP